MQIKEFRPTQRVMLNHELGQFAAESFAVGQQGVVSIETTPAGNVAVVRDNPRGGRQRLVYSAVGVVVYDEEETGPSNLDGCKVPETKDLEGVRPTQPQQQQRKVNRR